MRPLKILPVEYQKYIPVNGIRTWIMGAAIVFLNFYPMYGMNTGNHTTGRSENPSENTTRIFLCGDVMTGRGIDQILPHSVDPVLYESYVKDAREYVAIAETKNGTIDEPVSYSYIWGEAIPVWEKMKPDLKVINLETSITTHDNPWPGKGINYRMHPENVEILKKAGINLAVLANNHTLDWQTEGLKETLETLKEAGIPYAGAGRNNAEASKPAVFELNNKRLIVFSYGVPGSGVPTDWAAGNNSPGINFLANLDDENFQAIKREIERIQRKDDIVLFSVHWGSNWGYHIPGSQKDFAHRLIDEAGVDFIHGHSSHHPKGIEIYKNKLIIYGAGDFINDYEGIRGHEDFRGELALMYFADLNSKGVLASLRLFPMEIHQMSLRRASDQDSKWLMSMLNREGENLESHFTMNKDGSFSLKLK